MIAAYRAAAAALLLAAATPGQDICGAILDPIRTAPRFSVLFLLDNSGSMDATDSAGKRFTLIRAMLDSLAAASPGSEAGIIPFSRRLSFDDRDNPWFQPAFPGDTSQHDAYVPLTALDHGFPDGRKGADSLKAMLRNDGKGNLLYATKFPASRNNQAMGRSNLRDGTDITLAFQAARTAMGAAKAPKEARFLIFISDGEPTSVDEGRQSMVNEFRSGQDAPTTFTIFFTMDGRPIAPVSLVAMTDSIRINGYSASNPRSGLFAGAAPSCAEGTGIRRPSVTWPWMGRAGAPIWDAAGRRSPDGTPRALFSPRPAY